MALADRIKEPPAPNRPGMPCSIGALLDRLEGDERAALLTMLGTPQQHGWAQDQIFDALTAEGHKVGRQSINRHRGGKCCCERDER